MSKRSSKGESENKKQCIKEFKVTNKFKKMMEEVLPFVGKVLEQRKKDLSVSGWNDEKQEEFYKIMGLKGTEEMVHTYDVCDKNGGGRIKETDKTSVIEFMRKSVDRLILIHSKLYVGEEGVLSAQYDEVGNPTDEEVYKYGNFVNKTYTNEFSAYVISSATWNKDPKEYKENLEINIGQNFVCKPLMGVNSKVSTICHEISHFDRFGYIGDKIKGQWGGVGTDDLPLGDHKKDGKYITYAAELLENHSLDVFKNAYNFERYFQIIV
jgi:hypothetical protein